MSETDLLFVQGDRAEDAGDFKRALECFERGAALGDEVCWARLGLIYDNGIGVPVDKDRAMACYRKAWRQRSTTAAMNIAILYRERSDRRAMFRWFQRAAQEDDGSAQFELAKCYFAGEGVRRNINLAIRYLAAARGSYYITEAEREEAEALYVRFRPALV